MKLIVGLGNPGAGFDDTRHNAGFWLADALAKRWGLPRFKRDGPARATTGTTPFGRVYLMKPQTYMNESGRVLANLRVHEPEKPVPDLLVLVDDFAIPAGTMRLRGSGSAGGHNGLKSVQQALGTQQYARLRLGVGPVPDGVSHHDFVLEPTPKADRRIIEELLPVACEAIETWMEEGIDRAMARFNARQKADEA